MAVEVFGRDTMLGDEAGFNGNGGGALSGSELSHLQDAMLIAVFANGLFKCLHRHNGSPIIRRRGRLMF